MSVTEAVDHQRKRSFQDACEADSNSHVSSKRQKVDCTTRQAQQAARDRFWDTLSKVWLTPRALREFDRRNAAQSLKQRCTSNLELQSRSRSLFNISHLSAASVKNLKRFARRGGPCLVNLRICPEPSRSSFNTMNSVLKSSAYDRDFEQKCLDHGIYMPNFRREPENMQEVQKRLASRRRSLSPSDFLEAEFDKFRQVEQEARDEVDIISESLPIILGEKRRHYASAGNVVFGNMKDMAPDIFKKPKPDLYWGARLAQINQLVREYLNDQIAPSTKSIYPAAPNFFLEAKGPDGSPAVKTRQACYLGAIGARAMQALQDYGRTEPTYDRKAYTFSCTYHGGLLLIYSHHPTQPQHPDKPAEYHMVELGAWYLTGSSQTFGDGVSAFRNVRDLAAEQRDMLIEQTNVIAQSQSDRQAPRTKPRMKGRTKDRTKAQMKHRKKAEQLLKTSVEERLRPTREPIR